MLFSNFEKFGIWSNFRYKTLLITFWIKKNGMKLVVIFKGMLHVMFVTVN
jgi:hypothetical protein